MSTSGNRRQADRPNVILIVIDTARAGNFSCYGYGRSTTPTIDKISKEGTLFTTAMSASPWTLPSHGSIFTATLPSRHGAHEKHKWLDGAYPTLAEILARHGYHCEAISREFGFDRGFHKLANTWQVVNSKVDQRGSDGERGNSFWARLGWHLRQGDYPRRLANILYRRMYYRRYDYGGLRANFEVWRFLRGCNGERPFFLFINYMEPHLPYWAPSRCRRQFVPSDISLRLARNVNQDAWAYVVGEVEMTRDDFQILKALYDAELLYVDCLIAQVQAWLCDAGLLDDTLLILTSDHGENIGDHNLMDHQYCLYETLLKVPLIIRYPPVFPGGERVENVVRTLDILPTVIEIIDIKIPEDVRGLWQGISLLERSKLQNRYAVAEYWGPQPTLTALKRNYPSLAPALLSHLDVSIQAIRSEKYKVILYSDGRKELFDVVNDPEEKVNLADYLPEIVRELEGCLKQEVDYPPKNIQGRIEERSVDRDVTERLRALGYL
jgi:arylsulfatase A-like enzyme